jgi:glycosyltransferase 2 family protein
MSIAPGTLLRIAVALGLTTFILWQSDVGAVRAALTEVDWRWIAATLLLVLVDRALMAWRWLVLLRPVAPGSRLTLPIVLRIFFVSTFVGTFLPASIGGDALRAMSLSKHGIAMADSVASVLADRVFGTLAILLIATLAVFDAPAGLPEWIAPVTVALTAVAVVGVSMGLFHAGGERLGERVLQALTRGKLLKAGTNLLRSLRRYAHAPAALASVLTGSLAVQLLRITQAWMLGLALGIPTSFAAYLVYIPVILLVMLLPITINGLGTSQAAFVWLFAASGVSDADAFALSVLFLALGTVGNLPGGILYATGGLHGAVNSDVRVEENLPRG